MLIRDIRMKKKLALLEQQPLGAHLSISGGFEKTIRDGESIDCTAVAMFLHSNRQWAMKDLSSETINTFKQASAHSTITIFAVHASYLINFGSTNDDIYQKSLTTLTKELVQCNQLGIPYLIMHPGSYAGSNIEQACKQIAAGIDEAFENVPGKTMLLIENMAGQGSAVGSRLEELAYIRNSIRHKSRVGICFDTCHGFAAGYNFTTAESYKQFWQHFNDIIGIEHLQLFHLNDSKKELGSRVDRHEQIGKGKMGLETFKLLVNDEQFAHNAKILETPYTDYKKDALKLYSENLILLRNLIGK